MSIIHMGYVLKIILFLLLMAISLYLPSPYIPFKAIFSINFFNCPCILHNYHKIFILDHPFDSLNQFLLQEFFVSYSTCNPFPSNFSYTIFPPSSVQNITCTNTYACIPNTSFLSSSYGIATTIISKTSLLSSSYSFLSFLHFLFLIYMLSSLGTFSMCSSYYLSYFVYFIFFSTPTHS